MLKKTVYHKAPCALMAIGTSILLLGSSCCENVKKYPEVHITGSVPHAHDSSYVAFTRLLDTDGNNYFRRFDSVPIIDGHFKKTFPLRNSTSVAVLASSEAIPSIHLIIDGEGEIGMTIKRSVPYFDVTFTGKNAKGHDLIFDSSLLRVIHLVNVLNGVMEQGVDSPQMLIRRTEEILDSLVAPFDDLLTKEQITSKFFDQVKIQAEGKMLNAVHHIMAHAYRYPKTSAFKKEAIDTILVHFFTKYNPFSERYRFNLGIIRTLNAENKCGLIDRGLLPGSRVQLDIWPDKFAHYAFAPAELQEKMMATQIRLSRDYGENPICEDLQRFHKFKETFPESAYNSVFQNRYFDDLDCDGEPRERAIYPFATLGADSLSLIKEYQGNTLDSLVQERFSGRKVFVDLWATWCSPCIQEFGFIEEVKPVLVELGIEGLFVSIDRLRARKNWEEAIRRYRLEGSHFLVGHEIDSTLRAQLEENGEITIPRYLLFDEQGKLLDDDLPRPSSGRLIDRLRELSKFNN